MHSDRRLVMLAPTQVVWIPPDLWHRAELLGATGYRSVYLAPALGDALPDSLTVLGLSTLARAVLDRMAQSDWTTDWQSAPAHHWLAIALHELATAPASPASLPLPQDRRLAQLRRTLHRLPPSLHALAREVGASERTITRLFQRDTGMGYQAWRQQWRLVQAIDLLARRRPHLAIAHALGFAHEAAFSAFFLRMTGARPGAYLHGLDLAQAHAAAARPAA